MLGVSRVHKLEQKAIRRISYHEQTGLLMETILIPRPLW